MARISETSYTATMTTFSPCLDQIDKNHATSQSIRPLSDVQLEQLKSFYDVGLTYSSNALEGNSLTESETKVVIEDGLTIGGKPVKDHLEALGHHDAFYKLYNSLSTPITEELIKDIHHLFYVRLDEKNAGTYRKESIIVSGSTFTFPKPDQLASLMAGFITAITDSVLHPAQLASLAHREFVTIHPFIDGNGRTARLLMNLILLRHGYPITIIPPIYRHYYIDFLKDAQLNRNTEPFDVFIQNMVLEAQKDFIQQFS